MPPSYFKDKSVKEGFERLRRGGKKIEMGRVRRLNALGSQLFKRRAQERGHQRLVAYSLTQVGLRNGCTALAKCYDGVVVKKVFGAWIAHCRRDGVRYEPVLRRVMARLSERVEQRAMHDAMYSHCVEYDERKSAERALGYLRKHCCGKKAFRVRILRALRGNEKGTKRYFFHRWGEFTYSRVKEREVSANPISRAKPNPSRAENARRAFGHSLLKRRRCPKDAARVITCFSPPPHACGAHLSVLCLHMCVHVQVRMSEAALFHTSSFKRHYFNIWVNLYRFNFGLKCAAYKFRCFKARKALHKLRLRVLFKKSLRAFHREREVRSDNMLKVEGFRAIRRTVERRRRVGELTRTIERTHLRVFFGKFRSVYKAEVAKQRGVDMLVANVLGKWKEITDEDGRRRAALTRMANRYQKVRVLRAAKAYSLATRYFMTRCGWSFMLLVFREWRRDCERLIEGRRRMIGAYLSSIERKLRLAWTRWGKVVERLNWQEVCLRLHNRDQLISMLHSWRGFCREEKKLRMAEEGGARGYLALKTAHALNKLAENVRRRRREAASCGVGVEHYNKGVIKSAMTLLVAATAARVRARHLLERGGAQWERRRERVTMKRLWEFGHGQKIRKIQRVAALLMYHKRSLVDTFAAWKEHMRQQVKLRACVITGLALMKALAWKRWRSGCLHVSLRRRYLKSILGRWRHFVVLGLSGLVRGTKRRFFNKLLAVSAFLRTRRARSQDSYLAVRRMRLKAVWRDWQLSHLSHEFALTRSVKWKKERALYIMKKRGKFFGVRRRMLERWMGANIGRVNSVALIVWRIALTSFVKRGEEVWAGDVSKQRLYIAFSGLKVWVREQRKEGLMNSSALKFWRRTLLLKTCASWRQVRAYRIQEENRNETALGFWYTIRVRNVLGWWIERTAYFKELRRESLWNQQRAGFECFVAGVLRIRMRKRQRRAAEELGNAREWKMAGGVLSAWAVEVAFEKKDRLLRKQRQAKLMLMKESFLAWRMIVRGVKMTRLVHSHHEARFNESVEMDMRGLVKSFSLDRSMGQSGFGGELR